MHTAKDRQETEEDEAETEQQPTPMMRTSSIGGNRASLVFQQLHELAGATNSPWKRNSTAVSSGGRELRRSVTTGQMLAHSIEGPYSPVASSPLSQALPLTGGMSGSDNQWWMPGAVSYSRNTAQHQQLSLADTGRSAENQQNDEEATETARLLPTSDRASSRKYAIARRGIAAGAWLYSKILPTTSEEWHGVQKAVLAYAVAALFAFIPLLREWLGDPDYMSPHLVTNATIWFHAAKTRSGLAEGGLVGVIWVCMTSLVTYVALFTAERVHCAYAYNSGWATEHRQMGDNSDVLPLAWQSKVVSLGVFIFGYSWCLAFFKANANRPSVGTATAISNVALYLVMLREAPVVNYKVAGRCGGRTGMGLAVLGSEGRVPWPGGKEELAESVGKKTEHVLVAVLTGMAISFAVGWWVRPSTARSAVRKKLAATLGSFRELLPQLLAPIVTEAAPASSRQKLRGAKPSELKEGLRQHRQRLRQLRQQLGAVSLDPSQWHVWARRVELQTLVEGLDGLSLHLSSMSSGLELRVISHGADTPDGDIDWAAYAAIIQRIRDPVVSLAHTCDSALEAIGDMVHAALGGVQSNMHTEDTDSVTQRILRLREEIVEAIHVFDEDYSEAIGDLAVSAEFVLGASAEAEPAQPSLNTAKHPGASVSRTTEEQLFIVHFFVFGLREFVDELVGLLPQIAGVCRPPEPVMHVLRRQSMKPRELARSLRALAQWGLVHVRALWDTGATTELETRYEVAQYTDPRSLHAPQPSGRLQRIGRAVWRACMWMRRLNVKFATKYALLVTLLSLPYYVSIDMYAEFRRHRMDWMVISAAAIMVPTVGGSAVVSVYRVLGTCAGGLAAFLVYKVGEGTPWLMYVLLVAFSVPCFHIMLNGRYPKIGQFALITFGVVLINKWIAREDQAESAGGMAAVRTGSVALGVLAGMATTLYVWPFEARVRLRQALSWWLLTGALLYGQLWGSAWQSFVAEPEVPEQRVAVGLQGPDTVANGEEDGRDDGWHAVNTVREYLDSEMQLQSSLLEIRTLLSDTQNEPRLKGPFPAVVYGRIISASQRILDAMVAARWVMLPLPMVVATQPQSFAADAGSSQKQRWSHSTSLTHSPTEESSNSGETEEDSELPENSQGRQMLDMPIGLASSVLLERERMEAECLLALADARTADGAVGAEDVARQIRRSVERDLLRRTAAVREHRDALLSLTMYVLASALVLKTPLPAVLPPIQAAQRRVGEAMADILDPPDDAVNEREAAGPAAVRRAVARVRYVFYYTQVMLGWEVVHELSIVGGLMRELYGSHGDTTQNRSASLQR
ncbi:hypothetical protein COEREDRAFT_11934 [Coemansia reversa NRRL 1564]|uniref:Integral membrane bound transporter domain-containing protein n=1 Tax=Coemansia reversa (strain ATCC 12441 / NRRL 1564) TaxID=763665 RepID=A0A2G5B1T3_COERN|nr:hypothetical protein COEREDRAFT_11934 [Coemansia reversa NRRL 1564]|eukprot:PIA12956.1 hypothetical protein COEREDRAFT_11934 [Coemansia reversa NRRL 1564]